MSILRHRSGRRIASTSLLFMALLCTGAPGSELPDSASVTINILSKHIRLLREGRYERIGMRFPPTAVLEDMGEKSWETVTSLDIRCENGVLKLTTGARDFHEPFSLRVSATDGSVFTVILEDEKRRYPLPVAFRGSGGTVEIIVTEGLARYATDAATAEYGMLPGECHEALHALTLIIAARYHMRERPHRTFDFCDLTHCQVYRGRMAKGRTPLPDWQIDVRGRKASLLFHSRCGGRTFDERIFGSSVSKGRGVRDWISDEGLYLCRDTRWEREIAEQEMVDLLFTEGTQPRGPVNCIYDRKRLRIILRGKNRQWEFPPEDFRLRMNRIRGWNYIRSNNYTIKQIVRDGERHFLLSGYGLGHGVGFCQHGALALARRGYSRYEIIEHYFPGIRFRNTGEACSTPYLSYVIFDLSNGRMVKSSHRQVLERRIPAGSLFKILVSLCIAHERRDLIDYRFHCRGTRDDPTLPERCWDPNGHGENDLIKALALSCNLYFASLYRHLSCRRFCSFCKKLFSLLQIQTQLPPVRHDTECARLYAGLDFRVTFSVRDLRKLVRFITPVPTNETRFERIKRLYAVERDLIGAGLRDVLEKGTASGAIKPYGARINYLPLLEKRLSDTGEGGRRWGKTSTVVAGTNRKHSYGIFIGGDDEKGIVVLLRKGNGHLAAKWGMLLLGMTEGVND
jgi:SpoIID/LytB domain protein